MLYIFEMGALGVCVQDPCAEEPMRQGDSIVPAVVGPAPANSGHGADPRQLLTG